jgi:hypothetical protein
VYEKKKTIAGINTSVLGWLCITQHCLPIPTMKWTLPCEYYVRLQLPQNKSPKPQILLLSNRYGHNKCPTLQRTSPLQNNIVSIAAKGCRKLLA